MKRVTAREANQSFSRILSEAEAGEEIVITRHGKPVATLRPYPGHASDAEFRAAVQHAIHLMDNAPALGTAKRFTREEMHER